jgi:phosphatidyl-myo-inositol dimannoside synthase
MKTLFLTLRTFSATGGIEKVCRILGKALYEESIENDGLLQVGSMYDKQQHAWNNPYFPAENFRGYGVNKVRFIHEMVRTGIKFDLVILSHINLLPVGWLIKKLSPHTKLFLLAHGIEIWYPLGAGKRKWLHRCDKILAVSNYTANKISEMHGLPSHRVVVLNNCLDPFLPLPSIDKKDKVLLHKYGFRETDTIIMTLTRLSSGERYKGYDKVIEAMAALKLRYPAIKYLIAGRYDKNEKAFVENLLKKLKLQNAVVMAGFIAEELLEAYFAMSDIYIMPSRKEGFGIVFIEAMYYGLPVIAGNMDGSVDALLNGELGILVNPVNTSQIEKAIEAIIKEPLKYRPDHIKLLKHFGYESYKVRVNEILQQNRA